MKKKIIISLLLTIVTVSVIVIFSATWLQLDKQQIAGTVIVLLPVTGVAMFKAVDYAERLLEEVR